jgi:hypothetical protein
MIRCPKCSACKISGPYYRDGSKHPTGLESLEYICKQCGYTSSMPCHDANVSRSVDQFKARYFPNIKDENENKT